MHGVTKPVAVARPRSQGRPLRALLLLHRWMGIVIGTVMTLWCLTGFVMLFVDYPRLLPAGQLRALSPFHLPADGELAGITLPADTALASARLEMVVGKAVLRVVPEKGDGRAIWQMRASPLSYDLASGAPLAPLSRQDLAKVGMEFGRNFGIDGLVAAITPISVDQWTVQAFRANRPLYRVDYADAAGSSAYIAGLTGCFLTVTGIWVGISRLRRGKDGAIGSPYRGLWWWHHMAGLAFGLLALTWVGSGLFSMSPWGLFDSDAGSVERQRLAGLMRWTDMRAALANLNRLPIGTVRVESAPLGGKTMLIAIAADGRRVRIDGWGRPAILTRADVAAALRNGPRVVSLSLLSEGDSYYYAHKEPVRLPVWRAVLADPQATHLYIDAASGTLLRAVDGTGRAERWLWKAPHSFDLPGLRHSALRYIFVLPLLAAVTLVCGSGAWMGMRKLGRDLQRTRQGIRRRLSRRPSFLRSRSQS